MALNLQVDQDLNATAQPVKDQNGNTSPLAVSTDAVGVTGGGVPRFVVNSTNGLIGIGTAAPQRVLHIFDGGICLEPGSPPVGLFG